MQQWLFLAGAAALVWTPLWRIAGYWIVYLHELGHAVAALVAGGSVHAIRVRRDRSGVTEWFNHAGDPGLIGGLQRRASQVTVLISGYTAAGGFAVAAAVAGQWSSTLTIVTLWTVAGVCAVSLLDTRSLLAAGCAAGSVTAAVGAALAGGAIADGTLAVGAATAAAGGLRAAVELFRGRLERGDGSDPGELARLTLLPARLWAGLFVAVSAVAVAATFVLVAGWGTLW